MATLATVSTGPPHKRPFVRSRPEDDSQPQFLPIPETHFPATEAPTITSSQADLHLNPQKSSSSETSPALPSDLSFLTGSYSVAEMSIKSQSKITQKVSTLLSHLNRFNFLDLKAKPGLVALHAKASCANKLISVIEIAKREVTGQRGQLFQYSRLGSEIMALKPRSGNDRTGEDAKGGRKLGGPARVRAGDAEANEDGAGEPESPDEDEEPAFETMAAKELPVREKIRAVPTLTVYLSRVPVPELKSRFGEQTTS